MPGQYNVIIRSPVNAYKPVLVEYCYGQGYCFIDMMTYDWWTNSTGVGGRQDVLLQNILYIIFIQNNFNS